MYCSMCSMKNGSLQLLSWRRLRRNVWREKENRTRLVLVLLYCYDVGRWLCLVRLCLIILRYTDINLIARENSLEIFATISTLLVNIQLYYNSVSRTEKFILSLYTIASLVSNNLRTSLKLIWKPETSFNDKGYCFEIVFQYSYFISAMVVELFLLL